MNASYTDRSGQFDTRLRIAAVGMHGLRGLLESLAPEYAQRADIIIIDKVYEQARQSVQALLHQGGVDAVVSAGSNGSYLREHLPVPVATVRAGGFELMDSLAQLASRFKCLAMVVHGEIPQGLQALVTEFALPVHVLSYTNETQAYSCVQRMQELGVEAVLAPGLVVDLARAAGLHAVLLYSAAAVRVAMEDGLEMARASRAEAARHDRLRAMLGHLRDGVLAVDRHGRVYAVNPSMLALLNLSESALQGQLLHDVLPELDLQLVMRHARPDVEKVQQVAGRTLVLTRIPIIEQGQVNGAVLVCQDPVVIQRLDRSLRSRRAGAGRARYQLTDLVGSSPVMQQVRALALAYARSSATALIRGESGTGKELLAQGMHNASARHAQPFVAVNCGAFPESLLESELFGYVEGAFTGSSRGGKVGLFEAAHTGTLFLDEVGEMPLTLQTRLLRVLQEKEVLRVGATEATPVDVRIIAATHQNLSQLVEQGRFRHDLFYRLNILTLELPPLRERLQDLPELLEFLCQQLSSRLGEADAKWPLQELLSRGLGYDWPGNIRELENMVERLLVLHATGLLQEGESLQQITPELYAGIEVETLSSWQVQQEHHERRLLEAVLQECDGNRAQAADKLGISRSTLWRRMKAQGIHFVSSNKNGT